MTRLQNIYAAIWQRTCQQADFDPAKLAAVLRRNERTSYGLTLVLGCPLPPAITGRLEELKRTYHEIAPGRIHLREPGSLHLTVYGLKRSRETPLSRQELHPLLSELDEVLQAELGVLSTLAVPLSGSVVSEDGAVLVCGGESEKLVRLREAIGRIEGVDPLKSPSNHVTIGQFAQPLGSPEAYRKALESIENLRDSPLGELTVRGMKLAYYRQRLLHDVVSQEAIQLPVADTGLSSAALWSCHLD